MHRGKREKRSKMHPLVIKYFLCAAVTFELIRTKKFQPREKLKKPSHHPLLAASADLLHLPSAEEVEGILTPEDFKFNSLQRNQYCLRQYLLYLRAMNYILSIKLTSAICTKFNFSHCRIIDKGDETCELCF